MIKSLLLLAGLMPLIIFSIIFMIKKKKFVIPIISLVCSAAVFTSGLILFPSGSKTISATEERLNYLANLNMASGNLAKAQVYLDEMYVSSGDSLEGLLGYMRLSILKGDISNAVKSASALKIFLADNDVGNVLSSVEQSFIDSAFDGSYTSSGDMKAAKLMYETIKESGCNPNDYDIKAVTQDDITRCEQAEKELVNEVASYIKSDITDYANKHKDASQLQSAIELAASLNSMLSDSTGSSDNTSLNKAKTLLSKLNDIYDSHPDYFNQSELHDVFLKGLVKFGQYDRLISYAIDSDDYDAFVLLGNLYINGSITTHDFPNKIKNSANYDKVFKKCQKILSELNTNNLTNTEKEKIKSQFEAIKKEIDEPVLSYIEDVIEPDKAKAEDKSELFVQKSVLNSELSDKNAAYDNLTSAIKHVNESSNETLKESLNNINDSISGTSDSDNLTNVSDYFKNAYKASLPAGGDNLSVPESFINTSSSYVNEKRAMINIGRIDITNFPEIKAYISSSGTDISNKSDLLLTDCGMEITDYKLEKVQYSKAQVFLICDNSGSMSGSIDSLKEAVARYISSKNQREEISIITFDSSVLSNTGLTTNSSVLKNAINDFASMGGTNISSGINAALNDVANKSSDTLNVFIVMTDGEDSSYSNASSLKELNGLCNKNNIVIYTMGLGNVNGNYLTNIADAGNGSFMYASDSTMLEQMYTFIHNQLDNQYIVTFTAKDNTAKSNRILTLDNIKDNYYAKRIYSLNDNDDSDDNSNDNKDDDSNISDNPDSLRVKHLGISILMKSASAPSQFTIIGAGFDKLEKVSVGISNDSKKYSDLDVKVTNDTTLTVTVPAETDFGTYDVNIIIDDTSYKLSGLNILKPGQSGSITFGEYTFTAQSITSGNNNSVILKGNVILNDYLYFKGDVTLTGNLDSNSIHLSESSGSTVTYIQSLPGLLGKFFSNKITLAPMTDVILYSEEDKYDKSHLYGKTYYGPVTVSDPYMELKEDCIQFTVTDINLDFPGMGDLLDYAAEDAPFTFSSAGLGFTVTKNRVGLIVKAEVSPNSDKVLKLGPVKMGMSGATIELDTIHSDYKLGLEVEAKGIPFLSKLSDEFKFSFEIAIANGNLDSVDFGADFDLPIVKTPPVSLSSFHVGVEDLANGDGQNSTIGSRLLNATWYGQCDINIFKISDFVPGIDAISEEIADTSILSFGDTKLSLRISSFKLSLESTAKLLGIADLGTINVDLGHYDFSSYLLNIDSEVTGFHAGVKSNINLNVDKNFKINMDASLAIDINTKFAGFMADGQIDYTLKFFKKFKGDYQADLLIGVHGKSFDSFSIVLKGENNKNGKDAGFRITFTQGDFLPDVDLY